MANQVINGTLDVEVPGSTTPIDAVTINVQSFSTPPNARASHFIAARDIGAAPPNGFTHFIVRGDGNVGLGTANPSARLDVRGTSIIDAPASATPFKVLTVNAESFSNIGNVFASFFIVASDVGAAPPSGQVQFSVRGDGQVFARRGISFGDGTVQTTAAPPPHVLLQDFPGVGGPVGAVAVLGSANNALVGMDQNIGGGGLLGIFGSASQPRILLSENAANGGFVALLGPGGQQTVQISAIFGAPDNGAVSVTDAAGAAAQIFKAQLAVDNNGSGILTADVKNFRVPNPHRSGTDIVYACIEGPEAAAYVRGTSELIKGTCHVALPDHFASVITAQGMTVHLTPLSSDSQGLAVVQKASKFFVVRELHRGTGSYPFDWEVKCVRAGHEDYRVIRPSSERSLVRPLNRANR